MTSIKINQGHKGGFWFNLYDVTLPVLWLAVHFISCFNSKLRKSLSGRKNWRQLWNTDKESDENVVLIHAASYGEIEGIVPLVEKINESTHYHVMLSYSSPSALKALETLNGFAISGYMPLDFLYIQLRWLSKIDPSLILITKHDFWPNTIRAASRLNIPTILINANFHKKSMRNLPVINKFQRQVMRLLTAIWAVSDNDAERATALVGRSNIIRNKGARLLELSETGSSKVEITVMGDTRYDRVRQRADQGKSRFRALKKQFGSNKVFIAGSTWQPGEDIIWEALKHYLIDREDFKLIIAPHEPSEAAINRIILMCKAHDIKHVLFSDIGESNMETKVFIVDQIGILADLYSVGWAAYVGGGFGRGVHSVIEPAANDIPVLFGPNHHVSHEASLLIRRGGGFVVNTHLDIKSIVDDWLKHPDSYTAAASAASDIVTEQTGATERLMSWLNLNPVD